MYCLFIDKIRLQGGLEPYEGKLEYYREGAWHGVCIYDYSTNDYNYFDDHEATLVCSQLGFST